MSAVHHAPHITGADSILGIFFLEGFAQATLFPLAQAIYAICENVPAFSQEF